MRELSMNDLAISCVWIHSERSTHENIKHDKWSYNPKNYIYFVALALTFFGWSNSSINYSNKMRTQNFFTQSSYSQRDCKKKMIFQKIKLPLTLSVCPGWRQPNLHHFFSVCSARLVPSVVSSSPLKPSGGGTRRKKTWNGRNFRKWTDEREEKKYNFSFVWPCQKPQSSLCRHKSSSESVEWCKKSWGGPSSPNSHFRTFFHIAKQII